jgi:hypothetical protein
MHAGNNDPNVIHACVGNASKLVRIVGAAGSCITLASLIGRDSRALGTSRARRHNGVNGTTARLAAA